MTQINQCSFTRGFSAERKFAERTPIGDYVLLPRSYANRVIVKEPAGFFLPSPALSLSRKEKFGEAAVLAAH